MGTYVTDPKRGVLWWEPSPQPDLPPELPPPDTRRPPYLRSIGWAIVVWFATVAAVYFEAQVRGEESLGGWLGAAGFVVGYWIGGRLGGIRGKGEWAMFIAILSGVALVLFIAWIFIYTVAIYEYG
jgi:hypothetical protein